MLDVVRVLAAQAVLVGHLWSALNLVPGLRPPNMVYIQNVAVVVFFLLSGLLISYSLVDRRSRGPFPFRLYLIDRFSRIYSGLVPSLILIAILDGIVRSRGGYTHDNGYSIADFFGNLLMFQDYPVFGAAAGITSFGSGRVLWTLAIEWWLYMAFGWLALASRKSPRFWLVLVLFLPVPLFNLVAGRGSGLTAMWLLGFGGYLALSSGSLRALGPKAALATSALFGSLAAARLHLTKEAYDVLFAALAAASLVSLVQATDRLQVTVSGGLRTIVRYLADYSFTLYLVHLSVLELVITLVPWRGWLQFGLIFVAANVAAAILATFTEMRHRQLAAFLKSAVASRSGEGGLKGA